MQGLERARFKLVRRTRICWAVKPVRPALFYHCFNSFNTPIFTKFHKLYLLSIDRMEISLVTLYVISKYTNTIFLRMQCKNHNISFEAGYINLFAIIKVKGKGDVIHFKKLNAYSLEIRKFEIT